MTYGEWCAKPDSDLLYQLWQEWVQRPKDLLYGDMNFDTWLRYHGVKGDS